MPPLFKNLGHRNHSSRLGKSINHNNTGKEGPNLTVLPTNFLPYANSWRAILTKGRICLYTTLTLKKPLLMSGKQYYGTLMACFLFFFFCLFVCLFFCLFLFVLFWFCFVLFCFVMFCFVLFCFVLFCFVFFFFNFCFHDKYIRHLQALYNQSQSAVSVNSSLTDWFSARVGVRQGCIISSQLFNILLKVAMLYALHDLT